MDEQAGMGQDELVPGERLLAEWRPSQRVFWRKPLVWGAVSAVIFLAGAMGFGLPWIGWIIGFPLCVAAFIFIFGDYQEWFLRRNDRWRLTDRRLIFSNPDEAGVGSVPLDQIARVRVGLWALTLRLADRQTVTMSFLPDMAEIRDAIDEARAGNREAAHG